jgi:hypothetical protein
MTSLDLLAFAILVLMGLIELLVIRQAGRRP